MVFGAVGVPTWVRICVDCYWSFFMLLSVLAFLCAILQFYVQRLDSNVEPATECAPKQPQVYPDFESDVGRGGEQNVSKQTLMSDPELKVQRWFLIHVIVY